MAYETTAGMLQSSQNRNPIQRISELTVTSGISIQRAVNSTTLFGWQFIERVVEDQRFKLCIVLLICLNAIFIGVASEMSMQSALMVYDREDVADVQESQFLFVMEHFFNIAFMLELVLRLIALEGRFCMGPDWRWNLFDSMIVLLSMSEVYLVFVGF